MNKQLKERVIMCTDLNLDATIVSVEDTFHSNKILVKDRQYGIKFPEQVYWEGWVEQEELKDWLKGPWKRVEILASKFKQGDYWYDLLPGEAINGILLNSGEKNVLKIITRPSEGKENEINPRFPLVKRRQLL